MVGAADPAAAINEWIEHQVEELVAELETDLLRAACGFAVELIERSGQIAAGEAEQRHESRQRAAVVEEGLDRIADLDMVDGEGRRRWLPWHRRLACCGNELCEQVEDRGITGIAQARAKASGQAGGGESVERAGAPIAGCQNGEAVSEITAWREVGVHSAGKGGGAAHICGGSVRWIDLHDIKGSGLEREIGGRESAGDRHRAGCSCRTGSEAAAGVDDGRAHGAAAPQRGAAAHGGQARRRDRAIHDQRAGIHRRRPAVAVNVGERQRPAAGLHQ
jgi:hypothetical protein